MTNATKKAASATVNLELPAEIVPYVRNPTKFSPIKDVNVRN